ncbi:NADH dehydrogenase [ubiquinone] 1 alpha subcomplex subunit 7 [Cephus cinctus]|uniref:NADH dehydrogenase [ubiquinone] 1 alpha subcomplex subunit 7 n=1 Tax=Cephus cinctus TaxID=211228 RepID=A0AAJ7C3H6_CEPCN|nr:NADH dehydrogenase [ubiquinone] 1 alpha subcomplex subunit 7 [Cephus cinctus]
MPGGIKHRSNSQIIVWFQNLMRGAKSRTTPLRFADCIAARTQPPPNLPEGPYHKTSKIYYFVRDARREVEPPLLISKAKQITAGGEVSAKPKLLTPGKVWSWD